MKITPVLIASMALCLFVSCTRSDNSNGAQQQGKVDAELPQDATEVVLKEDFLSTISIPIHGMKMESFIGRAFPDYTIVPKWLTREGGEFLSYEIMREGITSGSLAMSLDDSTRMYEIVVHDSTWVDQYGVRVGDKLEDVWLKRMNLDLSVGYHFHLYARASNSRIFYELEGHYDEPDDVMFDRINDPESDLSFLNEWKVSRIVWSNHDLI